MLRLSLSFEYSTGARSPEPGRCEMGHWIDDLEEQDKQNRHENESRKLALRAHGDRLWEFLFPALQGDVAKINSKWREDVVIGKGDLGQIEITKATSPTLHVSVSLDVETESIRIARYGQRSIEANRTETIERLDLGMRGQNAIFAKTRSGDLIEPAGLPMYILKPLVDLILQR
jgi:hypothetical protein